MVERVYLVMNNVALILLLDTFFESTLYIQLTHNISCTRKNENRGVEKDRAQPRGTIKVLPGWAPLQRYIEANIFF
jgi:hypothetical protein